MVKSINAMETSETELRQAVAEDPELSIAVSAAETGDWSEVKENAFVRRRRELSLMNGLMFWGVRLVVPQALRRKFLEELHITHRGIVKMKAVARERIWWPNISEDIEVFVNACVTCQANSPMPPAEFVPSAPASEWERLHVDYMTWNGKQVLILVDAGSNGLRQKS
ncbi:Putative LOC101732012 (Silurana) [Caligus rogercresseyi]|uniref:RNA-directed DNA polymerase n=1 Tax=Caligus rogercresseyi TaxID=217165 RepID=A0A7T8JY74_CALRO|nr:Putative LOC101732012 (Silurana) [Caligus rogercresseyi]